MAAIKPHIRLRLALPDFLTSAERSARMARVGSKNTNPELLVRRLVHGLGYRFRLHRRDLPGRPDLAFPSRRKVIFVNGCFWHGHPGCKRATLPHTRREFWQAKIESNAGRDNRNQAALVGQGWSVLILWECELRNRTAIETRVEAFLGPPGRPTAVNTGGL